MWELATHLCTLPWFPGGSNKHTLLIWRPGDSSEALLMICLSHVSTIFIDLEDPEMNKKTSLLQKHVP